MIIENYYIDIDNKENPGKKSIDYLAGLFTLISFFHKF